MVVLTYQPPPQTEPTADYLLDEEDLYPYNLQPGNVHRSNLTAYAIDQWTIGEDQQSSTAAGWQTDNQVTLVLANSLCFSPTLSMDPLLLAEE